MIKPFGNRVLVEPITQQKKKGSIILPDTVEKDREEEGKVIAVGSGKMEDGKRISIEVKKGDVVLFNYGRKIKDSGKEYYIVDAENILAIK